MNEFRVITTTTEEQIFDGKGKRIEVRTSSETVLVSDVIQKTENETEKIDHQEYINSPKWKAKRQMVLERDNFRCRKCGTGKNLDVHHITYEHLGNEPLDDLVTLCRCCHEEVHESDINKTKKEQELQELSVYQLLKKASEKIMCSAMGFEGGDKFLDIIPQKTARNILDIFNYAYDLIAKYYTNEDDEYIDKEKKLLKDFIKNKRKEEAVYNYDAVPKDEKPLPKQDDFFTQSSDDFPKGF